MNRGRQNCRKFLKNWRNPNGTLKENLCFRYDGYRMGGLAKDAGAGGGCYWVHNTSHLQKPLSTRMGVAGHVTSMEE